MGKLTGRTLISANINEDLLIHVVDTTGTPASFKATLSQLYGVFPKNSSAGASDVNKVPKWTAANELGASIITDDGSIATIGGNLTVDGTATLQGAGDAKLKLVDYGTSNNNRIEFIDTGSSVRGYLGYTDANTISFLNNESSGDFVFDGYEMTIKSGGSSTNALVVTASQNVEIPNGQIKIAGGSPSAGRFLQCDATGLASWADVTAGVQVSGTPNNNEIAVWTNSDTIEGDSKFTWNGSNLEVNLGNEYSRVNADYFLNLSESDDANLFLYSKSAGTSVGSEIIFGRWNGTVGSESPLVDTQLIASQNIKGSYDSASPTNITTGALIQTRAAGAWTTSNYGVVYTIDTATQGSTTVSERFRIDSDGSGKFTSQVYSSIANTVTPSAGAATIDWNNGNMQVLDLQTGGNITTFTINNPKAGASYFIKIIQGGSNTITWPAAVKWAENDTYAGSPGAGDIDAVALTYDGTNYLANYSLDYQ